MSLTTELLKKVVIEKKAVAQDEMAVPKYANMKTPNNHVGNSSNATKPAPASGLGERTVKKPTAEVGAAGKERRDLEGPKTKPKKMSEAVNPVASALGIRVQNGILYFNHPNAPEQVQGIELDQQIYQFVQNALRRVSQSPTEESVGEMYQLLSDYAERGGGTNPRAMAGESTHKTAAGEMNKPSVKGGDPAKTAKVRGKQNDEPANKGNPGTGKEEKGQPKQQFTMKPKDTKGGESGENEHKSMKKMHESIRVLETLLGRKLRLKGVK
jgi:hypothetical protein